MTDREPAEVFPLAEYLCEDMQALGWTTADLAERMPGETVRNQMLVDLILAVQRDDLTISDETFAALAEAFGVKAEFFKRLDDIWRRWPDRRSEFTAPESIFEPRLYTINLGETEGAQS